MISLTQVRKFSQQFGVSESIIEKDYLIEIILWNLADHHSAKNLVFRGGTCLKKVYFPDYRFSEDLDFLTKNHRNTVELVNDLIKKINQAYQLNLKYRCETRERRFQFFINYNLFSEIVGTKELKIDIVEDIYIPPVVAAKLNFTYLDSAQNNKKINSYTLESVAADKIGRILDIDNEPRDIYDLWYILQHVSRAKKITNIFEEKYGYRPQTQSIISEIEKDDYKINWEKRLSNQINKLPEYTKVIGQLKNIIKQKF